MKAITLNDHVYTGPAKCKKAVIPHFACFLQKNKDILNELIVDTLYLYAESSSFRLDMSD